MTEPSDSSSALVLRDAVVAYGDAPPALDGVSLEVARGELHVLLGPSGSGKTTLLRSVAGFEKLSRGTMSLGGRTVDGEGIATVPPELRGVGFVFQDYALFPHLSVADNVAFPMRKRDDERVRKLLAQVNLTGLEHRLPDALSGGQQQRVALARALARDPEILLLDEPFSNIDKSLRRALRETTLAVLRDAGLAAIFVTHDAEEAMALGDRLSVLADGRLLQTGSAEDLYRRPTDLRVAYTFGDAVVLPVVGGDDQTARTSMGDVPLAGGSGGHVMVRPEDILVSGAGEASGVALVEVRFLGPEVELHLRAGERKVAARCRPHEAPALGPVSVRFRSGWRVDA